MIDATDQVGMPVITDCPSIVEHDGKRYEIPADSMIFHPGRIEMEERWWSILNPTRRDHYLGVFIATPTPTPFVSLDGVA